MATTEKEGDRLEADADALDDDMGKRLEAAGLEGLQDHARRQYEEWKEKGGEEIAE